MSVHRYMYMYVTTAVLNLYNVILHSYSFDPKDVQVTLWSFRFDSNRVNTDSQEEGSKERKERQ